MKIAVYYGTTMAGKRVHLGSQLLTRSGESDVIVVGFCGNLVTAFETGQLPHPSRAREFCRTCFRSLAWEVFIAQCERLTTSINQGEYAWT